MGGKTMSTPTTASAWLVETFATVMTAKVTATRTDIPTPIFEYQTEDESHQYARIEKVFSDGSSAIMEIWRPTTVSWQTAFWGIFAIAANTFLQEPGVIAHYKNYPGRLLRVSPWICAFDSVYIVLSYMVGFASGYWPRQVAALIIKARQLDKQTFSSDGGSSGTVSAEGSWIGGVMTYMLALTQLIKLTAMGGIPGTIACTWAYFLSYQLIWLTKTLAHGVSLDVLDLPGSVDSSTMQAIWSILIFQSLWMTQNLVSSMLANIVDLVHSGSSLSSLIWSPTVCMIVPGWIAIRLLAVPIDPGTIPATSWTRRDLHNILGSCGVYFLYIILAVCQFLGVFELPGMLGLMTSVCIAGPVSWVSASLGDLFCRIDRLQEIRRWSGIEKREQWLSWSFGLVFLILSLVHYAFCWDDNGTIKPEWTEILG